jgi:monofunctional glycosyltransferase
MVALLLGSILFVATLRFVNPSKSWSIQVEQVPDHFKAVLLAAEDKRFCQHGGFDWHAIQIALEQYRRGGKLVGASTLTQQLSKNLFLWQGRSWFRKGLEVWFTFWIETLWPKSRILEAYLNIAEFAPKQRGLGAALGQGDLPMNVRVLSVRQSVNLVTILPNPSLLTQHPTEALSLRRQQLELWFQTKDARAIVDCL